MHNNLIFSIAIAALFVFALLFYSYSILVPRNWHYRAFSSQIDEKGIYRQQPMAFYCHEANLLLINGSRCRRSNLLPILEGNGIMQISGVGFRYHNYHENGIIPKDGFSCAYKFGNIRPLIALKDGEIQKKFYFSKNNSIISVDDKEFYIGTDQTLVLLIEEMGDVVIIKSFEETFGINLLAFLRNPSPLLCLPVPVQHLTDPQKTETEAPKPEQK